MQSHEFATALGFKELQTPWSIYISWSTTDPKNWVTARKKLRPHDHRLLLIVNDRHWRAEPERRDEVFCVQWRESGISVESQQMKYRRLIPWLAITSPSETTGLIPQLEHLLKIEFVRYANVDGSLADEALSDGFSDHHLRRWLGSTATVWGVFS